MAVVETSVLQWSKKSRGWLHKWKLLEEVQTHQVSIWDTLDLWTHKCSCSCWLQGQSYSWELYSMRAFIWTTIRCRSTLQVRKSMFASVITCELIVSTYCIGQPALTFLFHLEEFQSTDYLLEQHQYCMHYLGRHNNNLNPCLWPQFYSITEHKH